MTFPRVRYVRESAVLTGLTACAADVAVTVIYKIGRASCRERV